MRFGNGRELALGVFGRVEFDSQLSVADDFAVKGLGGGLSGSGGIK